MKPLGIASTAVLFLLLGASTSAVALQEPERQEEARPPQHEEARPQQEARPPEEARPQQEARPPQHREEARPVPVAPERAEPGRQQAVRPQQGPSPEQRRTMQTAWEGPAHNTGKPSIALGNNEAAIMATGFLRSALPLTLVRATCFRSIAFR